VDRDQTDQVPISLEIHSKGDLTSVLRLRRTAVTSLVGIAFAVSRLVVLSKV
jgi:hypothetical protein